MPRLGTTCIWVLQILVLHLIFEVPTAYGMPVLKQQAKTKPVARAHTSMRPRTIATLGRYRDISRIKTAAGLAGRIGRRLKPQAISARCAIVIDAASGQTLFARAPDKPRQPASTIKVLTGMLAIDTLKNKDWVRVSSHAARQPRSKVYLDTRKSYRATDLINAVLLASANDASVALAEKIGGSESSFAARMTALARRWGAGSTVCKTASGLTARGQKTTARDLARIFRRAMLDSEFAARMKRARVRTTYGKMLHNHNKALWQIDGTLGGKTGYTSAARQTYVGKFRRNGTEIIVAILGSETMWTDIKRLVDYGFAKKRAVARSPASSRPGRSLVVLADSKKQRS